MKKTFKDLSKDEQKEYLHLYYMRAIRDDIAGMPLIVILLLLPIELNLRSIMVFIVLGIIIFYLNRDKKIEEAYGL